MAVGVGVSVTVGEGVSVAVDVLVDVGIGVGFVGTPDIDIYLGVSSLYLLIAEEMGLVGLGVFLAIGYPWLDKTAPLLYH